MFPAATVIMILDHTGITPLNGSTNASTLIVLRAAVPWVRAGTQAVTAGGTWSVGGTVGEILGLSSTFWSGIGHERYRLILAEFSRTLTA
jgi:NAD/NADP transhydrogenase alpha subunit